MLKYIRINNFKSIIKAKIEFPQFSIIIGKNGVGKTNLIYALKYLKFMSANKSSEEAQNVISLIPSEVFNLNLQNNTQDFEICFQNENEEEFVYTVALHLEIIESLQSIIVERESLTHNLNQKKVLVFQREHDQVKDANNKEIPIIVDNKHLAVSVYKNPQVVKLLGMFQKLVITDINDGRINQPFASVEGFSLPSLIVKLKTEHPEKFDQFMKIAIKMIPNFSSITEFSTPSTTKSKERLYLVLLEEKDLNARLSTMSISAGDLKTLYILALAVGIRSNSTLVIDEIENSFHPERLKDLIGRLQTISNINNLQIICTSHSPTVINSVKPSDIIFVTKSPEKGTLFNRLDSSSEVSNVEEILKNGGSNSQIFESFLR